MVYIIMSVLQAFCFTSFTNVDSSLNPCFALLRKNHMHTHHLLRLFVLLYVWQRCL